MSFRAREFLNITDVPYVSPSKYPAPVWLLETWVGKIGLHWDELSAKGVVLYSSGYGVNGKVWVGMAVVSDENVRVLLETLRGEVPPGILIIGKDSPALLT